ncbi:MAG TPA: PEP-CTERM sorting domain-containing protein [Caldimonas sp.]|jgi:hypothetical protein
MNRSRRKPVFLCAASVALACAMGSTGAVATPTIFADSDYSTSNGLFAPTVNTSTDTARTSTSPLDAGNFAAAAADASVGSVGIGMATTLPDGSPVSAAAVAQIADDWTPCPTCGVLVNLASVTFNMHFDGTLSPGWLAANAIDGEFKEFTGSFHVVNEELDFAWDGTQLAGTLCDTSFPTVCAPIALAFTTLADGSLSFNDNVSFTAMLFAPEFTTELRLSAGWDPAKQPAELAFLHTLRFDVVSNDPGLVWVSDAGQMSTAAVAAVPEPATMPLLGAGLLVLAGLARKARRRG